MKDLATLAAIAAAMSPWTADPLKRGRGESAVSRKVREHKKRKRRAAKAARRKNRR